MSLEEALLILHILGAFLMVGAAGVSTAAGVMAGRTASPRGMMLLLDLSYRAERFGTLPGALLSIVFGSWLVTEEDFSFGDPWVSAAYTLWLIVLAVDFAYLMPFNRKVRARAAELAGQGMESSEELRAMAAAPAAAVVGVLLDLSFIVFLYLMVVRPGS